MIVIKLILDTRLSIDDPCEYKLIYDHEEFRTSFNASGSVYVNGEHRVYESYEAYHQLKDKCWLSSKYLYFNLDSITLEYLRVIFIESMAIRLWIAIETARAYIKLGEFIDKLD